jgi:hypothetical protein
MVMLRLSNEQLVGIVDFTVCIIFLKPNFESSWGWYLCEPGKYRSQYQVVSHDGHHVPTMNLCHPGPCCVLMGRSTSVQLLLPLVFSHTCDLH